MPGSSKAKNYVELELPPREFLWKARVVDRPGKPDFGAHELGIKIKAAPPNFRCKKRSRANLERDQNAVKIAKQIELMLRIHGDMDTRVILNGNGRFVGRNGPAGRKCLIQGEHNKSDNCYFRISGRLVYYCCFDGTAHEYCASIAIGILPEVRIKSEESGYDAGCEIVSMVPDGETKANRVCDNQAAPGRSLVFVARDASQSGPAIQKPSTTVRDKLETNNQVSSVASSAAADIKKHSACWRARAINLPRKPPDKSFLSDGVSDRGTA